jgi:hypothetical protein
MTKEDPNDLVRKEAELIESGLALQSQSLDLLLAEMHALASLMTGSTAPGPVTDPKTEAEAEAETEAGFDNMPV